MEKELYCRDLGLDCELMVCGKTEDEVLSKAGQHILAVHGTEGFSKEFYNKARAAIREGSCDRGEAEEMIGEECSGSYESCFDAPDECCC